MSSAPSWRIVRAVTRNGMALASRDLRSAGGESPPNRPRCRHNSYPTGLSQEFRDPLFELGYLTLFAGMEVDHLFDFVAILAGDGDPNCLPRPAVRAGREDRALDPPKLL